MKKELQQKERELQKHVAYGIITAEEVRQIWRRDDCSFAQTEPENLNFWRWKHAGFQK